MSDAPKVTRLSVKVSPKASRDAVGVWMGEPGSSECPADTRARDGIRTLSGVLKVSVTAAPERGKANDALIGLLAEALDLPKRDVRVVRGASDARKLIEITGLPEGEILRRLGKPNS